MIAGSVPPPAKRLFFIALLPPVEIQEAVRAIQQDFADRYGSRAAQKSPPHITLQPPFRWNIKALPELEAGLQNFAKERSPISIQLFGFGAFVPCVIYVNVVQTPELMALQQDFIPAAEKLLGKESIDKRPYVPHMTVAFRDLTKQNFRAAWPEFQPKPLQFEFMATHLTLLAHNGQRWTIHAQFPFLEPAE